MQLAHIEADLLVLSELTKRARVPFAVQSVIIQIIVLSGMLPMGMGVATSIRVGHYLGQEKGEAAKRAATSGTGNCGPASRLHDNSWHVQAVLSPRTCYTSIQAALANGYCDD